MINCFIDYLHFFHLFLCHYHNCFLLYKEAKITDSILRNSINVRRLLYIIRSTVSKGMWYEGKYRFSFSQWYLVLDLLLLANTCKIQSWGFLFYRFLERCNSQTQSSLSRGQAGNGLKHFPLSRKVHYYFWVVSALEGYVSSNPGRELTERKAQPLCLVQPGYLQAGLVPQAERYRVAELWHKLPFLEKAGPCAFSIVFFYFLL